MSEEDIKAVDKEIEAERSEMDDEGGLNGPVDYKAGQPDQPDKQDQQEEFTPKPNMSEEEKKLVESMTRFMDSMASENIEEDDE
jgi:hypothetical protein